jgi:hypothetical protein
VRIVDRDAGTVEIEMPIPAVGLSPALRKLLRIAARSDVAVALACRHGRLGARRHALGGGNPLDDARDVTGDGDRLASAPRLRNSNW